MKTFVPLTLNKEEAKRWNFWSKQDFFNIRTYPEWIIKLLLKTHLKHFEGYHVFYFMTANGFDRTVMGDIMRILYSYDEVKIKQLLKSSSKEGFYNRNYFDLIERTVIYPMN